jgi:plasmid replication initiation protein
MGLKELKKVDGSRKLWVKKANILIEARNYLTTAEKKAFAIAVAFAKKIVNEVYGVAEIDLDLLKSLLDGEKFKIDKHFRDRLRRILKGLVSKREITLLELPIGKYKRWLKENNKEDWIKKLGIEDYNEGFIFCGVIDDITFSEDKNKIIVRFNRFITPMVLELKKRFTIYELKYVLLLSTRYGPQLYELLKKNEYLGTFTIGVEELKKLLGANTTGYKYWTQFYERVLKPSVEDINRKTDLHVQIEPIKGSHGKVVKIEFKVRSKSPNLNSSRIYKIISDLVASFRQGGEDITEQQFIKVLLSLDRVNPAIALWFLLHYPEGEARLYAWKHIEMTEANPAIKDPDRFLVSLIKDKNPQLDWLLDQRTKDLIRKELEGLAKAEKSDEEQTAIKALLTEIVEKAKGLNDKYEKELRKSLKVKDFYEYLLTLVQKKDINKLREVEILIEEFLGKQWEEELNKL